MSSFFMIIMLRAWVILNLTDSAFMVTAVQAIAIFPMLLAPIGGVLADRMNKKQILIFADGSSMVFAGVLTILVTTANLAPWHIFLLALLSGISFAIALPSRIALVGELVGEADLPSGASLYISIFSFAILAGPGIGGILTSSYGITIALLTGTFMIVPALAIFIQLLKIKTVRIANLENSQRQQSTLNDIREGIRYATSHRGIRVLLLLGLATSVLAQPYQSILPIFARDVLDRGADGLGALVAAGGIGAIPGSITIAFFNTLKQLRFLIIVSGIAIGIAIILFSLSTFFLLSVVLSFILGYLYQIIITSSFTVIQVLSPIQLRGRVMSLRLLGHSVTPLGMLLLGIGAEYTNPVLATSVMGAITLIAMLAIAVILPNFETPVQQQ
jgi:predicted MFS family arabinose efflux permease